MPICYRSLSFDSDSPIRVGYGETFSVPIISQKEGYSSKWIANDNNSYILKPGTSYVETQIEYTTFTSRYVKLFSIGDKEYEVILGSKFEVPSYKDERYTFEYWKSASGSKLKCCETIDESLIKQESYSAVLNYYIVFHHLSSNETMKITNEYSTSTYEIPATNADAGKHYKRHHTISEYWVINEKRVKGGSKETGFPILGIAPINGFLDAEIEYIRKIITNNRINRKPISSGLGFKYL